MDRASFKGGAVVSCGTLRMELESLQQSGFLDADTVLYCAPGLHEWPWELEKQLPRQLSRAAQVSSRVIVVYGKKCFMDLSQSARETDALIHETLPNAVRVNASNCVDMLASLEERGKLAGRDKVHWLTPGWLKHWDFIFKDWDAGLANEMFPQYDKAVVLDALGYFDGLMEESPERILTISDWMKIPIESMPVSLERFKSLLAAASRHV
jgi:hypothetical protein